MTRRLLPLVVLLGVTVPVRAYDGDGAGLSLLARHTTGVPARIAIVDPIGYIGLDTGLETCDIADANSPRRLGHLYLGSPVFDLVVAGSYAYLANGESGLAVIDVTDPAALSLVATLASSAPGASARGIAIAGSIVYVAEAAYPANASRLRIIDVSAPSAPRVLGSVTLPNRALDVVLTGGLALVSVGSTDGNPQQGVLQVDVGSSLPAIVAGGFFNTGRPVNEIALMGSLAYLAVGRASSGALVVADLGIPGAPIELGRIPLTDAVLGVATLPGVVLAAVSSHGLMSFDVSDPTTPLALDALPTGRLASAVATRGDVTLVAERSSIGAAGVNVVSTVFPASLRAGVVVGSAEATAVASAPGVAYLLRRDALDVVDTTTPAVASVIGTWRPPSGDFAGLAVDGNLVAIGENRTVHLVDATMPSSPVAAGSLGLSDGYAVSLVLTFPTLYVVTGRGLEIFDVNSPSAPVALGVYATPAGWSSAIAVQGSIGYLAAGDTIHVLDLSNVASPALVTTLTIGGEFLYGVAVDGSLLAASGYSNFIYAVDVSDPAAPALRGFLGGGSGFEVALRGDNAVVAAGSAGTVVVDLSDRLVPRVVALYDTSGDVYDLALDGDLVFLAALGAQHWLLWCDACSTGCVDSAPTLAANSLRVTRKPADSIFSWSIAAGWGGANLHRTFDPVALAALWSDMSSLVATTAAANVLESGGAGGGQVLYYRVFARSFCSGASLAP